MKIYEYDLSGFRKTKCIPILSNTSKSDKLTELTNNTVNFTEKANRGAEWFHISGKVGADTLKEIVENNDTKSGDLMVLQRKSKRIRKPNKRYITI